MNGKKGFFEALFDLSFTEFVTTKVIKLLFILAIIASAIGCIVLIVTGFSSRGASGIITLLLSPIIFILYVLIARIWLELVVVIFRIAENTGKMVEQGKGK